MLGLHLRLYTFERHQDYNFRLKSWVLPKNFGVDFYICAEVRWGILSPTWPTGLGATFIFVNLLLNEKMFFTFLQFIRIQNNCQKIVREQIWWLDKWSLPVAWSKGLRLRVRERVVDFRDLPILCTSNLSTLINNRLIVFNIAVCFYLSVFAALRFVRLYILYVSKHDFLYCTSMFCLLVYCECVSVSCLNVYYSTAMF